MRAAAHAARVLGAALLAAVGSSCARDPPPTPAPADSAPPAGDAAAVDPPRRPTKKWFMARTPARCEVYAVEGETVSATEAAPCPRYLEVGERIRVAGKTCIREGSADPARLVPVVCPDPLTAAEALDREQRR
jgi:hypothetical protein